jgi:hypothetical protein
LAEIGETEGWVPRFFVAFGADVVFLAVGVNPQLFLGRQHIITQASASPME